MVIPAATAAGCLNANMLGNQVRREGQQKQQDNLRRAIIAPPSGSKRSEQPYSQLTAKPARIPPIATPKFQRRAADGKDHRPHRHHDGEFQRYQTGGVVH